VLLVREVELLLQLGERKPTSNATPSGLDAGTSIPATTASCGACMCGINMSASVSSANDPEAENRAGQEEDACQKAESNVGLVLVTSAFSSDTMPVPNAATAHAINEVGKESEGNHPENEEDKIHWPFRERSEEW